MRQRFRRFLNTLDIRIRKYLNPPADPFSQNLYLQHRLEAETIRRQALETMAMSDAQERIGELVEARAMAGSGPWTVSPEAVRGTNKAIELAMESLRQPARASEYFSREAAVLLREGTAPGAVGAYGDIELALQNVEWRREINLSWLEFSRWGIQQIILICRLHHIKNPTIQRGINVSAQYVFGRGVEVSSPDPDANATLKEFFERNKSVLGQVALTDLERRKFYDGNLFFAFFADRLDSGQTTVRTIDATEVMDIVTDPNDTDRPWFYRRSWTERLFDISNGQVATTTKEAWYPALGYDPADKPKMIGGKPVMWEVPIYHRKCGAIAKWHFGCPLAYAALDWARASRRFLEACATVKQSLAQISMTLTTKGGQAALEGQKQQLSTMVGPQSSLWDPNPTPVNASIFGSGPGTTLQAFKTSGAGGDPEEVRRFELMVWRVFGLPETFGGDVNTGNLATAQSLDRPTELNFLEKQEAWREDLNVIARYVLQVSLGSASGQLREAWERRKGTPGKVVIMEAARVSRRGETVRYEATPPSNEKIEVMTTFPSIREGDNPALVTALVEAMTLGNTQGQVVGIDEKAGIKKLYELNGIDNGEELTNDQYPEQGPNKYDPNRTKEDAEEKQAKANLAAAPPMAHPAAPAAQPPKPVAEAVRRLLEAAKKVRERA